MTSLKKLSRPCSELQWNNYRRAVSVNLNEGQLDPKKATPQELRGEAISFGKDECSSCHTGPYYSDNVMHNLHVERFYKW